MKNYGVQIPSLVLLVLVVLISLVGCAKNDVPIPSITGGESSLNATSPKLSEDAAKAMQLEKSIDGIVSITLRDIEGNVIDRKFTEDEIKGIETAFNESFIMDTAHIEMITGYTMTIELEDEREVFISSYGQEGYIVARIGDGQTYHLGCEVIGRILLSK
ncbi:MULTISPECIES: hypothetical protein [unclassified Fusibacter]|uniref:hypothetical protein n=1 Tax=unclassified Fusibacter TaxID=2624464 RepID=UPI00101115D3|nr:MULTISPECIES: hypothetical protein [unclassified Fusibacter]MCK8060208.1 hypothetical protein [Fusibacter sp. A2]NPE22348.1 hypothetical protein [Fusibacter sp. A1]RXV61121.1 hypothetical protein DWB64_10915 [Fusibacter sp. A1]